MGHCLNLPAGSRLFGKCVVLNSFGCHNFPYINGYTIPFPSGKSILIRLSEIEFTDNLDRVSFHFGYVDLTRELLPLLCSLLCITNIYILPI